MSSEAKQNQDKRKKNTEIDESQHNQINNINVNRIKSYRKKTPVACSMHSHVRKKTNNNNTFYEERFLLPMLIDLSIAYCFGSSSFAMHWTLNTVLDFISLLFSYWNNSSLKSWTWFWCHWHAIWNLKCVSILIMGSAIIFEWIDFIH